MSLNLAQLKELMSPLSQVCQREKVVTISGILVTLKYLTPKQELEVQKMLPELDTASAIEFADSFRRETLCRSIVAVDNLDLRNMKEIETGEVLPNGKKVKVTREEAVAQIMEDWSKFVIAKLFEAYGELGEEIQSTMDESLKLNIEDKEVAKENLKERIDEIERAQKLEELKNEKEVP